MSVIIINAHCIKISNFYQCIYWPSYKKLSILNKAYTSYLCVISIYSWHLLFFVDSSDANTSSFFSNSNNFASRINTHANDMILQNSRIILFHGFLCFRSLLLIKSILNRLLQRILNFLRSRSYELEIFFELKFH